MPSKTALMMIEVVVVLRFTNNKNFLLSFFYLSSLTHSTPTHPWFFHEGGELLVKKSASLFHTMNLMRAVAIMCAPNTAAE